MFKNIQRISLVLISVLIAGGLSAKETIKVGVVTPLSGNFAALKELADVMQARAEQLNAREGAAYRYEYIFEDSQFQPARSHMAATKLLKVDKVDVLVSIASLSAKVALPLVEQAKVPHLILGGDELAKGEWNFTYFFTAGDCANLWASTAKRFGYQSYVAMGQRQEAGMIAVRALKKAGEEIGIEEKAVLLWNPSDSKDFRGHLLRAKEANPDCIVFFPTPPDPDILLKQYGELGMDIPLISIESLDFVQDKSLIEGLWLAGCPVIGGDVAQKIRALGVEPSLPYDVYVYDFPSIIAQACEGAVAEGPKLSGEAIRESLAGMKTIQTIQGEVAQDDEGAFHPMPVLVYYEDGVGREVSADELLKLKQN